MDFSPPSPTSSFTMPGSIIFTPEASDDGAPEAAIELEQDNRLDALRRRILEAEHDVNVLTQKAARLGNIPPTAGAGTPPAHPTSPGLLARLAYLALLAFLVLAFLGYLLFLTLVGLPILLVVPVIPTVLVALMLCLIVLLGFLVMGFVGFIILDTVRRWIFVILFCLVVIHALQDQPRI